MGEVKIKGKGEKVERGEVRNDMGEMKVMGETWGG